ncbi:SSI family serine proteinase inhibitor [Streptomyces sp. TRM 70351]|uniref:SSI family serine proteinase inhibitor n=1 Tax=Streptomyces sp. TRM 70351 TaxID=3116552 RepID=UPI002E7AF29F|nr:SSI family serine proteinase inhibitor [Streptomyces sp. TRM 70351]MEE1928484.1 SSI family serine proteinase inhibitor [Streptomyces sp. TRM 70351]
MRRTTTRGGLPVRSFVTAAAALTALTTLALPTAAGAAESAVPQAEPSASLTLTITASGPGPGPGPGPDSVTLECGPAGGTHPTAMDACAVLAEARGDFGRIKPDAGCDPVWAPVVITATGNWYGEPVSFEAEHPSRGCAEVATGYVFLF